MPSFEILIVGAPVGFAQGCIALNELAISDETLFLQLVNNSLKKCDYVPNDALHKSAIKSINYIVRATRQAVPVPTIPQIATALAANSFLTRDFVEKIVLEIQSYTANPESELKALTQSSGRLSNFAWRMGVSVCSSKCNSIYSPYVAVSFDINEPNGKTTSHSAELTYDQFKDFSATFDKVARVMDSL